MLLYGFIMFLYAFTMSLCGFTMLLYGLAMCFHGFTIPYSMDSLFSEFFKESRRGILGCVRDCLGGDLGVIWMVFASKINEQPIKGYANL